MAVGGVVELMSAQRIRGWAVDTDTLKSAVLDLCIEGQKVKRVRCLKSRLGFDRLAPNGAVGFKFKLHSSLLAYVRSTDAVTMQLNGVTLPTIVNRMSLLPPEAQKDPSGLPALMANGHIITKQGELRLSVRYDRDWQDRFFSFYDEARATFRRMFGYDLFVCFGGLLGYVRDGELILTDDDLDCSYFSRHTHPELVRQEFIEIHKALRDAGEYSKIAPIRRMFLKWTQKSGRALVDVFPGFVWGNDLFMAPGVGVRDGASIAARGVRAVEWYGHEILVPVAAEEILAAAYGPGWNVYDPLFQWTFPRYARHGVSRITLTRGEVAELNAYRRTELALAMQDDDDD